MPPPVIGISGISPGAGVFPAVTSGFDFFLSQKHGLVAESGLWCT